MYYGMSMTKSFVLYLVTYVGRIFGAHVTLQVRMPLLPLADHWCLSSTRRDPENQFLDESRSSNFFLRRGGRPSVWSCPWHFPFHNCCTYLIPLPPPLPNFFEKNKPITLKDKSLLELWVTTFLPDWQPHLIFYQFISNFLFMCSNSMASAHVILK